MKVVEKIQNTYFVFKIFSRKSCRLWDNAQKYGRARQTTDDDMTHEHCTLGTWGYKHTLRIRNTYCFSTVTMVTQTRLGVSLYFHCHFLLLSTCLVVIFWAVTRCTPVFTKRPNFLNSSPTSTEGALGYWAHLAAGFDNKLPFAPFRYEH